MNTNDVYAGLEPQGLWNHFAAINRIPRPSGREHEIATYVRSWARAEGFAVKQDATGNLCVWVPATASRENTATVVLQAHLDMVCERNSDSPYDPEKGNIHVVRNGDWIQAEGSTLGADNGIGVAALLHVGEAALPHGPLDLLFTVDEETGLTGASKLDPSIVRGRVLLNLDSEEDGVLCVGCAGGCDTTFRWTTQPQTTPAGLQTSRLSVSGLQGGHSGGDIDKNRLNAIKAMARLLDRSMAVVPLRIGSITGGNKRNAIPRECWATIICPRDQWDTTREALRKEENELRLQYQGLDDGLVIQVEPIKDGVSHSWDETASRRLISLLCTIPSGVISMTPGMTGLVETSNNLSVITTTDEAIDIRCLSRSSSAPAIRDLLNTQRALARLAGTPFEEANCYPGWRPNLSSRVLAVTKETHRHLFGKEPAVTAVHGGLECGLIGDRIPGMDMVSFGPEIRGPHAPGERVQVSSVPKFWRLLSGVLDALSTQGSGS